MDATAKGVLHSAAVFFGPALIKVAKSSHLTSHPDSILTISSTVATFAAAVSLPILGSWLDRTSSLTQNNLLLTGRYTAYTLIGINAMQIFLAKSTSNYTAFFIFWASHAVSDYMNIIHSMIVLTYIQNLTSNVHLLSQYSSKFAVYRLSAVTVFVVTITLYAHNYASEHNDNDSLVHTSMVAHIMSAMVGLFVLGYAWAFLFRPISSSQPTASEQHNVREVRYTDNSIHREQTQLLSTSSTALIDTSLYESLQIIRRNYPALKWFLATLLWSPSVGSGSYIAMMATLQVSLVQMTSTQIGMTNILALLATIPGAKLGEYVSLQTNPLVSFRCSVTMIALSMGLTSILVHGPDQTVVYIACNTMLAMGLGWLMPVETVLYCTLCPPEHSQRMGLMLSVHSAAAWIPPLLFSIVIQLGYKLNIALASQMVLLGIALACSTQIGHFHDAVRQARAPMVSEHE